MPSESGWPFRPIGISCAQQYGLDGGTWPVVNTAMNLPTTCAAFSVARGPVNTGRCTGQTGSIPLNVPADEGSFASEVAVLIWAQFECIRGSLRLCPSGTAYKRSASSTENYCD